MITLFIRAHVVPCNVVLCYVMVSAIHVPLKGVFGCVLKNLKVRLEIFGCLLKPLIWNA